MKNLTLWMMVGLGCALVACGPETRNKGPGLENYWRSEIADTVPSGIIDGQDWTMRVAEVERVGNEFEVHLYSESLPTCISAKSGERHVSFIVPAEPHIEFDGRHEIGLFFKPPITTTLASGGVIDVRTVSDTSVTMGVIIEGGDDNFVNGTFTAPICP